MATTGITTLPLGSQAPEFSLPDAAGAVWPLQQLAGSRGTLVAFVCNHCPYVKHVATDLGKAAQRWAGEGIGVVAINSNDAEQYPDDRPERMAEQVRAWGWGFPYLVDAEQTAATAYGAVCTPDFFLFDDAGTLVYRGRFDGSTPGNNVPLTGDELGSAVQALLDGAALSTDKRPSVGCSIKWKPGNEPG
jgi:thiol-disulfide isomerase/thioredoxin